MLLILLSFLWKRKKNCLDHLRVWPFWPWSLCEVFSTWNHQAPWKSQWLLTHEVGEVDNGSQPIFSRCSNIFEDPGFRKIETIDDKQPFFSTYLGLVRWSIEVTHWNLTHPTTFGHGANGHTTQQRKERPQLCKWTPWSSWDRCYCHVKTSFWKTHKMNIWTYMNLDMYIYIYIWIYSGHDLEKIPAWEEHTNMDTFLGSVSPWRVAKTRSKLKNKSCRQMFPELPQPLNKRNAAQPFWTVLMSTTGCHSCGQKNVHPNTGGMALERSSFWICFKMFSMTMIETYWNWGISVAMSNYLVAVRQVQSSTNGKWPVFNNSFVLSCSTSRPPRYWCQTGCYNQPQKLSWFKKGLSYPFWDIITWYLSLNGSQNSAISRRGCHPVASSPCVRLS